MNRTIAKIFMSIIAVALIVSQFWSCSTAQSITPVTLTTLSDGSIDENNGDAVLLFKLLNPILPKEGPVIRTMVSSDGLGDDKTDHVLMGNVVPLIIPSIVQFVWTANVDFSEENKVYEELYALSIQARGPPVA